MNIRWSPECRALARWMDTHSGPGSSTIGEIGIELGFDKTEYHKLYRCIRYWREKFIEFYKYQDEKGILHGNPKQKWLVALENFHVNYMIQPLFFDKDKGYFIPNLAEKEDITADRVIHWIKSGQSVSREAMIFHEILPSMATPAELMGDLKLLQEKVEDGNVPRCKTCGQNIQESWVACPSCGQPLPLNLEK